MSNTLSVRVTSRKTDAGDFYEGTVSLVGLKPTKLARRSDGSTQFPTKSAVGGAARNLAKALGFANVDIVSDVAKPATKAKAKAKATTTTKPTTIMTTPTTATTKKAAKQSSVSKTTASKPTNTQS